MKRHIRMVEPHIDVLMRVRPHADHTCRLGGPPTPPSARPSFFLHGPSQYSQVFSDPCVRRY